MVQNKNKDLITAVEKNRELPNQLSRMTIRSNGYFEH